MAVIPPMDFPANPVVGQKYTAPVGTVYVWDGLAWDYGFYDSETQQLGTIGELLDQIRILLQDTDLSGGQYRYSTESLILAVNQGMLEMLRMRPDIFLENYFVAPQFSIHFLSAPMVIELQFVPSLVYYAVGMAQLRDEEPTQDDRAGAFLKKFNSMLMDVA